MNEHKGEVLHNNIAKIISRHGKERQYLLPVLIDVDAEYGYITENALVEISKQMDIPVAEIHGVKTFYAFLDHEKQGKYSIYLCRSISCDMAGKDRIVKLLEKELNIGFGETTKDGKFTLNFTNCMGMCDQGPAMLVNKKIYTKLTPEKVFDIIEHYRGGRIK